MARIMLQMCTSEPREPPLWFFPVSRMGHHADMPTESRHLTESIDRAAAEVYAYVRDPAHLPAWAAGLAAGIRRERGEWVADSPMGRVLVRFVPVNEYGVLDHDVVLPSGESVTNPLRVLADGAGSEVVFTVRRRPGMTDEDFAADTAAVAADLAALKRVLEAG
jgi:hypothetical protein